MLQYIETLLLFRGHNYFLLYRFRESGINIIKVTRLYNHGNILHLLNGV